MALDNEKKNQESKERIIHNLQKELANEKKKEEPGANTIQNLKNQLENMKKKGVNCKDNPWFEEGIGECEDNGV